MDYEEYKKIEDLQQLAKITGLEIYSHDVAKKIAIRWKENVLFNSTEEAYSYVQGHLQGLERGREEARRKDQAIHDRDKENFSF